MLVQALAAYADTYLTDKLADQAFEEKPVPYLIEIDGNGKFIQIIENSTTIEGPKKNSKKKKIVNRLSVPKSPVNRNSPTKFYPLLACDFIQYVLGSNAGIKTDDNDEEQKDSHQDKHEEFINVINQAAEATGEKVLDACVKFYSDPQEVSKASNAMMKFKDGKTATIALSVRYDVFSEKTGGPVIKNENVRNYWRKYYAKMYDKRHEKGGEGTCLISGKYGPLARNHNKVKASGLGNKPEFSLMSFDKPAFWSYGWKNNTNSPVNPERAAAYVLALNDLLKPGIHRIGKSPDITLPTRVDYGGLAFLFWTKQPCDDDPFSLFERPSASNVEKLLKAPWSGDLSKADFETNHFYMMTVSGNGARLVVRDWFHELLPNVMDNVRNWFNELRIIDFFSGDIMPEPPRLFDLLITISPPRIKPEDKANASRAIKLVRRAIYGDPLGREILSSALARLRVEKKVNQRLKSLRMGLIKLCVNDSIKIRGKGEKNMPESLDQAQENPAYICGRLLAIYENLQLQAHHKKPPNVTVADKYFGLASIYPQLAFPKLELLSKAHLKKLRRDKKGAYYAISNRIDELTEKLISSGAVFPKQFNIEDQGRFAIGYHHQKADDRRRAKENEQKKKDALESVEENGGTSPAQ